MTEHELISKALKIRSATGAPMHSIIKSLRENPDPETKQPAAARTSEPSADVEKQPKKYIDTAFYREVEALMDTGLTYQAAYRRARRDHDDLFQKMLEQVNR